MSTSLLKKEGAVDDLIDKAIAAAVPQLDLVTEEGQTGADVEQENSIKEARTRAVETIKTFIGNVDSGKLGFMAVVVLIAVAISLLTTIEKTFNDIWGVPRGRAFRVSRDAGRAAGGGACFSMHENTRENTHENHHVPTAHA